jgi:phospholipid transport system substrate-binding protein
MTRRLHSALAGMLLLFAFAASAGPIHAAEPRELVEGAINRVLDTLRAEEARAKSDPDFVLQVIEDEILPLVDIEGMARLILARHWRDASPEQRRRFTEAFRHTLLQAYGVRLADYLDRRVIVIARRSRQDDRMAVVATEIEVGRGQPNILVNYRLRPMDGKWKVFDVEAEGLSFVGNFRTSFNTEIGSHGLDALIARLEAGDRSLIDEVLDDAAEQADGDRG